MHRFFYRFLRDEDNKVFDVNLFLDWIFFKIISPAQNPRSYVRTSIALGSKNYQPYPKTKTASYVSGMQLFHSFLCFLGFQFLELRILEPLLRS